MFPPKLNVREIAYRLMIGYVLIQTPNMEHREAFNARETQNTNIS